MKRLLFILCFTVTLARASEPAFTDFLGHVETLEAVLTERPVHRDFQQLSKLSSIRADFIVRFWRQRALVANDTQVEKIGDRFARRLKANPEDDRDKIGRELKEEMDMLFLSYYYDHIDEIHGMIRLNIERGKGIDNAAR